MPYFVPASRSEPSRTLAFSSSGTPKACAISRTLGSARLPLICGKFVRWMAPVCRSIPCVHLATISLLNRCASWPVSEPFSEPGKLRLRSRRSGR